jgi:hypothetical protein
MPVISQMKEKKSDIAMISVWLAILFTPYL